jgi:hypothetical protein
MHSAKEYLASVEIALAEVRSAKENNVPLDKVFIERTSAKVHLAWLTRNEDRANEIQKLFYLELPEEEKEKDRFFVYEAIKIVEHD